MTDPTFGRPGRITGGTRTLAETRPLGAEEIGDVVAAFARRGWSGRLCLLAPGGAATL